ncbi:hypothetical protein J6590_052963 [Homalodisca vitripennis]|nr:hypothetical protein J6590_052963 [Homalodisca vitripennis]
MVLLACTAERSIPTNKRAKNVLRNKMRPYSLSTKGNYQLFGLLPKCFPGYVLEMTPMNKKSGRTRAVCKCSTYCQRTQRSHVHTHARQHPRTAHICTPLFNSLIILCRTEKVPVFGPRRVFGPDVHLPTSQTDIARVSDVKMMLSANNHFSRAFKIQKQAIRIIAKMKFRESCKEAFKTLQLLTLPCLYILETSSFCLSKCALTRGRDIHEYETRGRDAYRTGRHRTGVYEHALPGRCSVHQQVARSDKRCPNA